MVYYHCPTCEQLTERTEYHVSHLDHNGPESASVAAPRVARRSTYLRIRPNWRGIVGSSILSFGLGATALWGLYTVSALGGSIPVELSAGSADASREFASLPPCATEDATDCAWDAATQGNGEGTSFVNYEGVTYRANTSAACTESLAAYSTDYDNAVALATTAEQNGTVLDGFTTDTLSAYSARLASILNHECA